MSVYIKEKPGNLRQALNSMLNQTVPSDEIILVDYKYSSLSKDLLVNKYSKQLELYQKALEYGLGRPVSACYILDIKSASLVSFKKY